MTLNPTICEIAHYVTPRIGKVVHYAKLTPRIVLFGCSQDNMRSQQVHVDNAATCVS